MSPSTITLLFLLFAVIMFVIEKTTAWGNINDRLYRTDHYRCTGCADRICRPHLQDLLTVM